VKDSRHVNKLGISTYYPQTVPRLAYSSTIRIRITSDKKHATLKCGHNGQFRLTNHLADENIPSYAILSHTWRPNFEEEVTIKDLVDGTGKDKPGYDKIRFCADQVERDGLIYFWVDTCCIDQSNNNELAEAINSMFRWTRS